MITLTNVAKHYNDEVSIGPVDLEIPAGGVTALVGPNGAGKSTLLTMIGRLVGMDEGTIEVAGYDVTSTKSADLAKIVSILRQENHFVTRLTVRQLVGFGRFPYSRGRLTAKDERAVSEAIDFLDLGGLGRAHALAAQGAPAARPAARALTRRSTSTSSCARGATGRSSRSCSPRCAPSATATAARASRTSRRAGCSTTRSSAPCSSCCSPC